MRCTKDFLQNFFLCSRWNLTTQIQCLWKYINWSLNFQSVCTEFNSGIVEMWFLHLILNLDCTLFFSFGKEHDQWIIKESLSKWYAILNRLCLRCIYIVMILPPADVGIVPKVVFHKKQEVEITNKQASSFFSQFSLKNNFVLLIW